MAVSEDSGSVEDISAIFRMQQSLFFMDRKVVETFVILRREPRLALEGPRKGFGIVIAHFIGNVVYLFIIHKQYDGLRYTRFHHIFLRRDTVKPGEFLNEMCARILRDPGKRIVRKVGA